MNTSKLIPLLTLAALLTLTVRASESDLKADLAKMQGKWKATVTTDRGSGKWTLEFKENKTKILIENSDNETVFKGESEFKLEEVGKFRAYTYFNLKILSGDREGQTILTDGKTRSSVYKLGEETFTTVSGLTEDETEKPRLITWEKVSK